MSNHEKLKEVRYAFLILDIFFCVHGLGMFTKYTKFKSLFPTVLALCLAILYEVNAVLFIITSLTRHDISENKSTTALIVLIFQLCLKYFQRCCLYIQRKTLASNMQKLAGLYSRVANKKSKMLKFISTVAVFELFIICIFPLAAITHYIIQKRLSYSFLYSVWYYIVLFCVVFKAISACVALYFCFVCFLLKDVFIGIEQSTVLRGLNPWMATYTEAIDIAKAVNKYFSSMLMICCTELLCTIFYESFSIFFLVKPITYDTLQRFIHVLLDFSVFIMICLSASAVKNCAKDAAEKFACYDFCARRNGFNSGVISEFQGFTLLDSIIIDKSLILSALATLLTYGVMIAMFNASSKEN